MIRKLLLGAALIGALCASACSTPGTNTPSTTLPSAGDFEAAISQACNLQIDASVAEQLAAAFVPGVGPVAAGVATVATQVCQAWIAANGPAPATPTPATPASSARKKAAAPVKVNGVVITGHYGS